VSQNAANVIKLYER